MKKMLFVLSFFTVANICAGHQDLSDMNPLMAAVKNLEVVIDNNLDRLGERSAQKAFNDRMDMVLYEMDLYFVDVDSQGSSVLADMSNTIVHCLRSISSADEFVRDMVNQGLANADDQRKYTDPLQVLKQAFDTKQEQVDQAQNNGGWFSWLGLS